MPKCKVCLIEKEESEFSLNYRYTSGRRTTCKSCSAEWARDFRRKNTAQHKAWKYKVSTEAIEKAHSKTHCEICGLKLDISNLRVDHDHKSGKLRGTLCNNCNLGLGHFFDNKDFFLQAIQYLKEYS